MSGGEKIINRIKSDCDESVKAIELEAQAQYDKVIDEAKAEIETIKKAHLEKESKRIAQIKAAAKSKAELEIRNELLKKRREEIDKTVGMVLEKLLNLEHEEYFNAIYKLASKLSGMNGEIILNQKDLNRLPLDFEDKLRANGLDAKVSDKAADIDGGFILKHGDIEENMEFKAIIAAERDRLEDLINRELFI